MVGKKIILGISGSIAAYKAAFLTRLLVQSGAEVQILMTESATQFITPLTLSTLSKRPVHTKVSSEESWNNHVELGLWADAMIIAPTTATTLAKLANGIADNVIVATYLSARCPVFFAPAMDLDMWLHPSTKSNVQKLQSYGNQLIDVAHGELASGLVGNGRMAEPEFIVDTLKKYFSKKENLVGKIALITAGPTFEPIDPVRFIGNRSSGKMGIALAKELAERGAKVKLILGPSALKVKHPNIDTIRVTNAQSMYEAAQNHFEKSHISILAAAVADYRPINVADQKIKKKEKRLTIELEKTMDIAATLGKQKRDNQLLIGFALETNNEIENAKGKLMRKNLDFIVLNSLKDQGAGFAVDTNKITILRKDNKIKEFELKSKTKVAIDIVNEIVLMIE
ncbi:MAG: bifunctional phosphopantothenoylcysteine decarboxylase/phosphopantothenate--cysteine ligase CoaBC [Saprospiraceae bacterium]|jgi:phosphopantothenoylcysteine decarboxylase/phosphopantothenate--cysteine ligase|nr:bifunctional phosphopantothenoylcysteine decarboxylase/phosphopantothenate--cysteine ligase CoaBC [Saprospiraceae bacterium]MDG1433282.1 bifunctional phosphopantothenoylcysteine decarboxylase/phosphopantothenate--cysteine ligase CoaBC [Saprospiraceae bacterium]MDG2418593.1 bifunctional phosphopantothenoylcysteine decarboxylase/phosphopantothenate--cysteine ligase CoaBC [Saprospiraceae bacterium]